MERHRPSLSGLDQATQEGLIDLAVRREHTDDDSSRTELDGRPEAAGDAYSQAFLMEATEQTYLLCQQLGFYSNMETLTPALFNALGQSKVKLF